jgi:hypothetical protein
VPPNSLGALGTGIVKNTTTTGVLSVITEGTGVEAALGNAVSGSGSFCLTTSCVMVTPTLGVASATTINKVTLTAPGTGSTLTIADAKTLTASNTLTFSGTDGSTLNVGAGGTLGSAAFQNTGTSGATLPFANGTNTWSAQQTYTGNVQIGSSGGAITKVLRSTTFSGAFGTISANSTAAANITATGVKPGDNCVVTPNGAVTTGIVWSCYISANDVVVLVLAKCHYGGR